MRREIVEKIYYKIVLRTQSSLAIGCGDETRTDSDVVRNSKGQPYIPATALAGVYRHLFDHSAHLQKQYFGDVEICNTKSSANTMVSESRLITYDANLSENQSNYYLSTRDCVALDESKVAKDGAKFNFQVLEAGVTMVTFLEFNRCEEDDEKVADTIVSEFLQNGLYVGAKSSRGYGHIQADKVYRKRFSMRPGSEDMEEWLGFNMFDEDVWNTSDEITASDTASKYLSIRLKLKQEGGISIRRYTTEASDDKKAEAKPDSEQLTIHTTEGEQIPVIPGTSWAGAFRSRMTRLVAKDNRVLIRGLFGYVDEKDKKRCKSVIRFHESQIQHAIPKIMSRNAIDRFTSGTIDGALFTEKTYYYGDTELLIDVMPDRMECTPEDKDVLRSALTDTILDLHSGLLAVGGLTAIGRGLFSIERMTVNGNEVELSYAEINNALESGGL